VALVWHQFSTERSAAHAPMAAPPAAAPAG